MSVPRPATHEAGTDEEDDESVSASLFPTGFPAPPGPPAPPFVPPKPAVVELPAAASPVAVVLPSGGGRRKISPVVAIGLIVACLGGAAFVLWQFGPWKPKPPAVPQLTDRATEPVPKKIDKGGEAKKK